MLLAAKGFLLLFFSSLVFVLFFSFVLYNDSEASSSSSQTPTSLYIQLTYLNSRNRDYVRDGEGRLWLRIWKIYEFGSNNNNKGYPVSKTLFKVEMKEIGRKSEYFVESSERALCDLYNRLRWAKDHGGERAANDYRYYLELLVDKTRSIGCAPIGLDGVGGLNAGGAGYVNVCMRGLIPVFWVE